MKNILTTFLLLFLLSPAFAQQLDEDLYEDYKDQAVQDNKAGNYDNCIANALKARYYNEGNSTFVLHELLMLSYYHKGLYSVSKLLLWDAKRLFGPFEEGSDREYVINKVKKWLNDKGYTGDAGYPKGRFELVSNRDEWVRFMTDSKDDIAGSYKICATCGGPDIETYYYNQLYFFGKFAYEACIEKGTNFNEYLYFLNNFKGTEYFNEAERFTCKKMGALIAEHEEKAQNYERLARSERVKGNLMCAVLAPVSLVALISGAKNLNKNAGNAVLVGTGIGGTIFGIALGAPHFTEAQDYDRLASKERKAAADVKSWYPCSDYLLRQ